ncbi:hypothetical protein [Burkholderia sp. AU38729]|uniref:hypothetical protein n=1 Tax=Burkholderia sp. AU38729 TaxID=2879633 RepID=UPI001CF2B6A4|nr:hypothetical protein [Burkholderia sp. AU38729]MCA8064004.1 hypothetical protein [Burkholderia sp. AU38729]
MINIFIVLISVFVSTSVWAKNACVDFLGEQSYPPLSIGSGVVCFVQEPVLDRKTGMFVGADSISLYYLSRNGFPIKAEGRGLLYDDTPGEIVDAFFLRVGRDRREKVFVIHSFDVRYSLVEKNSSGKFYSVSVFELAGDVLRQDEHAADWFGADYSWLSDGNRVVYRYPYQSRKDVRLAMKSSLALLINGGDAVRSKVKRKTYLFNEPNIRGGTKKYLIESDRVAVERATAGWCKVDYSGGAVPVKMWLLCSALDVGGE